jgi:hypothetical protein
MPTPQFDPSQVTALFRNKKKMLGEQPLGAEVPLGIANAPGEDRVPPVPGAPEPSPSTHLNGGAPEELASEVSPIDAPSRDNAKPPRERRHLSAVAAPKVTTKEAIPPSADAAAAGISWAKLTAIVSEEVLLGVYQAQANLRARPGMRAGQTKIGRVVDELLRKGLGLPPLPPVPAPEG